MSVIARVFFRHLDKAAESKLGYDAANLAIGPGYGDLRLRCAGGKRHFVFCSHGVSTTASIIGMAHESNTLLLVVFETILLSLDDNSQFLRFVKVR